MSTGSCECQKWLLFYKPNVGQNQVQAYKCTNLYNFRYTLLRQVYKIVLCLYGQVVQICTPMPVFSQITMKLLQTVSNTTQIQGK